MGFCVIIPARYGAARLPGKPLHSVAGRPLIQHVYERAAASSARRVVIATDDPRISETAQQFGAQVCMTSAEHHSGSDRLAEAAQLLGLDDDEIVVNLQGDEPLISPRVLDQVAHNLEQHAPVGAATLCEVIEHNETLTDPHVVKVVMDRDGYALYFTRAAVPWDREAAKGAPVLSDKVRHFRHIGIYAYRCAFLKQFVAWQPCELERAESLEQLRILWYGHRIHVAEACMACPPGVDTREDVARVEALLQKGGSTLVR